MKPLLYLEFRQLINTIKSTLRSPKRLIPALLMAAWMGSWIIRSLLMLSGTQMPEPANFTGLTKLVYTRLDLIETAPFLFLSLTSLMVIYQAFGSGALIFSISQIDFLFPTPISKRKVLILKLVKDYLKYGFWVVFFLVFCGLPMIASMQQKAMHGWVASCAALVAYLILVINLAHTINIVFTFGFERLKQTGWAIKALLLAAATSAIGFGIAGYAKTGDSLTSLVAAANSPIVEVVFMPARWCSGLLLASLLGVTVDDKIHLALLWLMAIGSFLLLLSRRENLYEPSLGVSIKYARARRAMRSGDHAGARAEALAARGKKSVAGLPIPAFGSGAVTLVWKNLLAKYRVSHGQLAFMLLIPGAAVLGIKHFAPTEILQNIPFLMLYLAYVLAMVTQADVRAELRYANVLKAMPIAAWKMMLAQIISGVIYMSAGVLSFSIWILLLVPEAHKDILIACALGIPFIGYSTIAATTISSLLYPDNRDISQNYICGMISVCLVSVAILPTIVAGVVMVLLMHLSFYYAFAVVAVLNLVIGTLGVILSGTIFRTFDPTSE